MTDKQENLLRMYYAVSAICDANLEIWQSNEVFLASYKKFQLKIPEIQKYKDILKMETIATETFKSIDRIELEEMAFYISGKLLCLAKDSSNKKLVSEIIENRNNLLKVTENELVSICNSISLNASTYINELSYYDISTESLVEFQHFLTYYSSNLSHQRHNSSKRKTTQDILKKCFKDAEELLKGHLDTNISFFKNSDPDFYNQYKAAREVINFENETIPELSGKLINSYN